LRLQGGVRPEMKAVKHRLLASFFVVLVACGGSDGGSSGSGGTPNDGDCPEKDSMLAIQDLAVDPYGPGGANVTDEELADIQEAIANVPSDC
jgi:hypothetical protein